MSAANDEIGEGSWPIVFHFPFKPGPLKNLPLVVLKKIALEHG